MITDRELDAELERFSIAPGGLDHEAHVRVAWSYLQEKDGDARFRATIAAYVARVGAAERYHETLTVALLRIIAARVRPGQSYAEFRRRNADLYDDARAVLARHYSDERLASAGARERFVDADREPLP